MKKLKLCLFFLGNDEVDNFLQTEQAGKEDGSAIDDKRNGKTNQPVDIQLFDKEGDDNDASHEKDDMEPIMASHLDLDNTFGEKILQEGRDGLYAKAGASRSHRLESWYDNEIQQDIDDYARCGYEVELFETSIGGKERSEDVGR